MAPRGCAAAKDRPAGSRALGALLKPQSPPLPLPPLRIPPGRGRGLPGDGRAPAPIPSAQHIATRRGLAGPGRSPSVLSQSAKDGTPPPASPTSHPPPSRPWPGLGEGSVASPGSGPMRLSQRSLAKQGTWPEEEGERVMRMGRLSAPGRRPSIWVWSLSPIQGWDIQNPG